MKRKFTYSTRFLLVVIALLSGFWSPVSAEESQTEYTGDIVAGRQVISRLEAGNLPSGRHYFYFQAPDANNGQRVYVPVMVLKGTNPGPRLLLTAAVHGDELNGIAVIHRLLGELSHEDLSGTLIAVPGVNQSGLAANSRYFIGAGGGQPQSDPNRLFPGKLEGGGAAERYIGNLWHKLLSNNADLAVDLHTQTTGLVYPLFVFADMRNQRARRMAYALNPEMIKNDGGEKGTLETTLMENGIPAVTFEIGAPKRFQPGLVAHAVDGLKSLMATEEMLESNEDADTVNPFVGTSFHNVYAENGGPIHIKVTLGQEVQKGDLLALGYNAFGVEIKRYSANRAGRVVSLATDPLREPGALIVRILY